MEQTWNDFCGELKDHAKYKKIENFINWEPVYKSMFVGNAPYVIHELNYLKGQSGNWNFYKNILKEDSYGCPQPFPKMPLSSGNIIHHTCHIVKYMNQYNIDLNDFDAIVEFGGGYGSFARVAHRIGFKGSYLIYDLKPFSSLQQLFLEVSGFKTTDRVENVEGGGAIICETDIERTLSWIEKKDAENNRILFVATWSLSETSLEVRKPFIDRFNKFSGVLLAYQSQFQNVNNSHFFANVKEKLQNGSASWVIAEDDIPGMKKEIGRYLFGYKGNIIS